MSEAPLARTIPFLAGERGGQDEGSGGPRILRAAGGWGPGLRPPPRHLLPDGELSADGAVDGPGEELPQ
jgi:hypothetical protein